MFERVVAAVVAFVAAGVAVPKEIECSQELREEKFLLEERVET